MLPPHDSLGLPRSTDTSLTASPRGVTHCTATPRHYYSIVVAVRRPTHDDIIISLNIRAALTSRPHFVSTYFLFAAYLKQQRYLIIGRAADTRQRALRWRLW